MQNNEPTQSAADLEDQLYDIVNRMLEPFDARVEKPPSYGVTHVPQYPFDISKPTQHDTKAEFQLEYDMVAAGAEQASKLFETLFPRKTEDANKTRNAVARMIDKKFSQSAPTENLNESFNLVRKNASDVGGYSMSLIMVLDLRNALIDRLQELENQKEEFWSLPYRAPDYHARFIALRLAQLFARETQTRPTYGSSGETGDPSTSYSRALKEVFSALGFTAQERNYAKWAVDQITEKDMKPKYENALRSLMGPNLLGPETGILGTLMGLSGSKKSR